jgi:glycosyltransferase involved in cell wall biosynthesis
VSVTLPCYDEEDWIASAIESVLDQSYERFELIIVDDGSTDDTESVVQEYMDDHRIRYIYKPNGGYPSAQSRAFDEAQGDYYAIMEADDLWEPEKLERQMEHLTSSSAMLCHTNAHLIDESGNITGEWHSSSPPPYEPHNRFMNTLLLNNFICNPSVVVDSKAVGSKRYPDQFVLNSDHFMWLRIASEHPVEYLPEKLTRKRFHEDNISANYIEIFENRKQLVEHIQNYHEFSNTAVERKYSNIQLTYAINAALDGKVSEARGCLKQSIAHDWKNINSYIVYILTYFGQSIIRPFVSDG